MKRFFGMTKLMNKYHDQVEKILALLLIAYAISLWFCEALRSLAFSEGSRKYSLYSGIFVFLKLKPCLSPPQYSAFTFHYYVSFRSLLPMSDY
jgi:hypothetical protein